MGRPRLFAGLCCGQFVFLQRHASRSCPPAPPTPAPRVDGRGGGGGGARRARGRRGRPAGATTRGWCRRDPRVGCGRAVCTVHTVGVRTVPYPPLLPSASACTPPAGDQGATRRPTRRGATRRGERPRRAAVGGGASSTAAVGLVVGRPRRIPVHLSPSAPPGLYSPAPQHRSTPPPLPVGRSAPRL